MPVTSSEATVLERTDEAGAVKAGRILVVDDDPVIRNCVVETLREEGYEVSAAGHGKAALDLLLQQQQAEHSPDLILLDMRMPVMDGWAFARAYREQVPGPHAPIVVITAAHDSLDRVVEIGASDVLPKPFDLDQLVAAVDRCARPIPGPEST